MLLVAFAALISASEAFAQRGGQHLNSPGYQRALAESRKPKAKPTPSAATIKSKRARRLYAE